MIILIDILFALVFAIVITIVLAAGFKRRGPWDSIIVFFIIVFLATWAGGIWLFPFGPVFFGVSWIPFVIVGLVTALILASAVPPQLPPSGNRKVRDPEEQTVPTKKFDFFMIAIIAVLMASIVVGYLAK